MLSEKNQFQKVTYSMSLFLQPSQNDKTRDGGHISMSGNRNAGQGKRKNGDYGSKTATGRIPVDRTILLLLLF